MGLGFVVCCTRCLCIVVMVSYCYVTTIIEVRRVRISYFLIYPLYSVKELLGVREVCIQQCTLNIY
jgi:hypothetical protein